MPDALTPALETGFTLFLSLLVEALPFLLLGVLFSSVLFMFVDEKKLLAIAPKNAVLAALMGSAMGFLFPVCECGNVPVARRLLSQGIPTPLAVGFLLAAPTINPIVIWSTWTAFQDRPELVVLRVVVSLFIATTIGWVFGQQEDLRPLLNKNLARSMLTPRSAQKPTGIQLAAQERLMRSGTYWIGDGQKQPLEGSLGSLQAAMAMPTSRAQSRPPIPWGDRLQLFLDNVVRELRELGGVLVFGSAVAAIIQTVIPRELVLGIGQGAVSSIITMMVLAAAISICSTVDAFFALSFSGTFTSGSLLAFLTFGPMIDLKAVGLLLSIFRPKAVFYLFGIAGSMTFLCALFINYQLGW
ncbi:MAG: permease [Cyanobacteria bacterium P01_D01_bin.73]